MSQLILFVFLSLSVHCSLSTDIFDTEIDDIFSSVIGPVFAVKKTPLPISNNTKTLNIRAIPTRFFTINKLRRKGKRATKIPLLRAPTPHSWSLRKNAEEEKPRQWPNMIPQNKLQLERLLQEPVQKVPDFDKDIPSMITQQFDQIQAEYQKKIEELGIPSNFSRRTALTLDQVKNLNPTRLAKIAASYNLDYSRLGQEGADLLTQYYFQDREALERSIALIAQFIYVSRFKFLYAQKLKARYQSKVKYRIGYTFSVLENLVQQFYSCFYAMVKLHRTIDFNSDDSLMDYLKLYERTVGIQVEFYEVNNYLHQLEIQRIQSKEDLVGMNLMKDRLG